MMVRSLLADLERSISCRCMLSSPSTIEVQFPGRHIVFLLVEAEGSVTVKLRALVCDLLQWRTVSAVRGPTCSRVSSIILGERSLGQWRLRISVDGPENIKSPVKWRFFEAGDALTKLALKAPTHRSLRRLTISSSYTQVSPS